MKEYWTSKSEQIIQLYMLLDSWAMCLQWESGILANACMGWMGCINFIGPLLAPYIIATHVLPLLIVNQNATLKTPLKENLL
jgi:hypothetical protein